MLYLKAAKGNPKLSEELHKVKNPTPESLYATAEAWEIAQTQQRLTDNPRANSATTSKNSKGKNNFQKSSSHATAPANSFQRNVVSKQAASQNSNFKCFRCGNKDRNHKCVAMDAVCKFCNKKGHFKGCLLYTSPSPRDKRQSRMPSSA